MALTGNERRALAAQANPLRTRLTIGAELSDPMVAQVRETLGHHALLKVRVATDDRDTVAHLGRQLAERVPCEVVQRVGRVLVLYRHDAGADDARDGRGEDTH